jgi:hypothetical protein
MSWTHGYVGSSESRRFVLRTDGGSSPRSQGPAQPKVIVSPAFSRGAIDVYLAIEVAAEGNNHTEFPRCIELAVLPWLTD